MVVIIDFEKCFDRIEHKSIAATMRYFGFGVKFVRMLMLLYNGSEMSTSSNGYLSQVFSKTRGTNQGCPGSPLVFNYCSETMAHLIFGNKNIHRLEINGIRKILSQFADDTSAYLKFERLTLENFTHTLRTVEAHTGLKVSYNKTTIYRVGSLVNTDAKIVMQAMFQWSNEPIKTLGVSIPCDGSVDPQNFEDVLQKV